MRYAKALLVPLRSENEGETKIVTLVSRSHRYGCHAVCVTKIREEKRRADKTKTKNQNTKTVRVRASHDGTTPARRATVTSRCGHAQVAQCARKRCPHAHTIFFLARVEELETADRLNAWNQLSNRATALPSFGLPLLRRSLGWRLRRACSRPRATARGCSGLPPASLRRLATRSAAPS